MFGLFTSTIASTRLRYYSIAFILSVLFVPLFTTNSYSQVATGYTFSQGTVVSNPASTSSGNVIIAGYWDDNVATFNFPGGFTFTFNGTNYTSCKVNSNGYITFGATAPAATNYAPINSNAGYAGAFGAWAEDLADYSNAPISYTITGTAPNRVLSIKWVKATRYAAWLAIGQENGIFFSINLYETSNIIEVAYGNCTMNTTTGGAQIGLRGTSNSDFHHRNLTTNVAWLSNTTLAATNAQTVRTRSNAKPSNLYTFFQWTPACAPPNITSVTVNNATTCGGNGSLVVNGTSLSGSYTVTYTSSVAGTVTTGSIAAVGNTVTVPNLAPATYTNISIKAVAATCSSNTLAGPYVISSPASPSITSVTGTNATTCGGTGSLTITAVSLSGSYAVTYTSSIAGTVTTGAIASVGNTVTVTGLAVASYSNISIKSTTTLCTSNTFPGPVIINNPISPSITSLSSTGPTTCGGSNGTITINGTSLSGNYTVTYTSSITGTVTSPPIAAVANAVTLTGLPAATYTAFSIKSSTTLCTSNTLAGPVVLSDPTPPAITVLSITNTTTCGGSDGTLVVTGTSLSGNYTVTYTSSLAGLVTTSAIASVGNTVTVTGLPAASYSAVRIQSTTTLCNSNVLPGPVVIADPAPPVISGVVPTDPTTCSGSDGTITISGLNASTAYTLSYNAVPQAIISDALGNYTITGLAAGNYNNIYVVRFNCTSNIMGPVTLSDPAPPVISGTSVSNTTTCGGSDGSFTVSGLIPGTAYTLSYNAVPQAIVTSAAGDYMVTNLPAGTYSNIYVVRFNCTSNTIASLVISDPAPPVIVTTASGGPTTCLGTDGYISLQGLLPTTNYAVSYDDGVTTYTPSIVSDAGGNVIISNLPAGTYGNINVTINNCTSSSVGPITLSDPPTPVITATTNAPICEGQVLQLMSNVTLNGNPTAAATYSWTGPAFGTPNTQANPVVPNAPASATGTYTVTATIANCTSAPFMLPVTVYAAPVPPSFSANTPLCSGNDLHLDVAGADPSLIYIWTGPGFATPDSNVNATIPNAQVSDGGTYNLSVVNPYGCGLLVPSTINVVVNQTPNAPVPVDVVYCQADAPVALTATPSGNPADTLKWYTVPTGGLGTTTAPVPSTAAPGTYTWYVSQTTQPGCEGARAVQTVLVKPKPTVPVSSSPAVTYCQFDSTAVALVATGDSLQWYTVPTGGTPSSTAPVPPTATPGVTVWYVTQTQDGCESDRLAISVTIIPKPQPPLVSDVRYCQYDEPIALTATGQNLQWYDNPQAGVPLSAAPIPSTQTPGITTWYVSQTVNGCESNLSAINVTVYYKPTADIKASREEVCQGDTLLISYVGNGSNTTTYNWTWPASASVVNGTGQGPYVVRFDAIGNQTITLVATENNCSSPMASHSIKVKQTPGVEISLRNNIVCTDELAYLELNWTSMETTYAWDFGQAHTRDGQSQATGKGPYYIEWDNAGKYTVSLTVTSSEQCSAIATDTVEVHPRPEAKITASAIDNICSGEDIELYASTNNSKYTYHWLPAQQFDYNYNSPVVKVHADKTGYISLEVTDEFGCTNMDSVLLNTKPCCELYLPSAFSPNGDGKNDLFRILNPGRHELVSLTVYNRYGQQVFTTSNEKDGWNGATNGVAQEIGVYQYLVKYKCEGKDTIIKGDVTLVR